MTKKENHYNQEFFNKLAEKLEEIYPKGSKERSSALVFNAYANMIANEIIEKEKREKEKILDFYERFVEVIEWGLKREVPYENIQKTIETIIGIEKGVLEKLKQIGECPFCGKKVYLDNFRDSLSLSEFRISGLCQKCQDEVFK